MSIVYVRWTIVQYWVKTAKSPDHVCLAVGNPNHLHFLLGWSPLFAQTPCLLRASSPPWHLLLVIPRFRVTATAQRKKHEFHYRLRDLSCVTETYIIGITLEPQSPNAYVTGFLGRYWHAGVASLNGNIFGEWLSSNAGWNSIYKGVMCLWTTYPPSHHLEVPWHNPGGTRMSTSITRAVHLFRLRSLL